MIGRHNLPTGQFRAGVNRLAYCEGLGDAAANHKSNLALALTKRVEQLS